MIAFPCAGCGHKLKVKDELAGKKGKCPHCGQAVVIPASAAGSQIDVVSPTLPPGATNSLAAPADTLAGSDNKPASELTAFLAPAQKPGELGRLGSYRVLKVLGAGGMGVVFLAEDPHLERAVALKAMLPGFSASGEARERFLREAKAAAAVKHDHVVTIYQVGEDRGAPFLAMEFLEGQSLDDRLKKQPKLPLEEVLRIGREIAEGLAAAHERGLVHRDIKPANVWLEGSRRRVKILDFGLARAANPGAQLTQTGAILGTPAFMSPEQTRGQNVDHRCDLFSLGVVLYRMITGELPFKGADAISTLMAVATETPTPLRRLNAETPIALENLVTRLLAKNAGDRPASAHEVAQELAMLERQTASPTTVIPPPPRWKKDPSPTRRSPFLLAAAAAAVLLIGGVAALLFSGRKPGGGETVQKGDKPATTTPRGKDESRAVQNIEFKELPDTDRWVQLFDGKTLNGWKVFPGGTGSWKVQDGAITCSGPPSHLFSERGDYENFHFRVEAMINAKGNSGQYFRAEFARGHPKGYEAQIALPGGDIQLTGSLYSIVRIKKPLHEPNEWFTQEVVANGDHILIDVNGKNVVDVHDGWYKRGHFALQHNSPQTVVKFRKIEVKELPPSKP